MARVEFRQRHADGSSSLLALSCGSEPQLAIEGFGADDAEGYFDRLDVEREVADRIWRVVVEQSWRDWDSCEPSDAFPRWRVEVSDGSRYLNQVECRGELPEAWRVSFDALNEASELDDGEEFDWPFDADYWRDELGYYRHARR